MRIFNKLLGLTLINILVLVIASHIFRLYRADNHVFLLALVMGGMVNFVLIFMNILLFNYPRYTYHLFTAQIVAIFLYYGISMESFFTYILVAMNFLMFFIIANKPFKRK